MRSHFKNTTYLQSARAGTVGIVNLSSGRQAIKIYHLIVVYKTGISRISIAMFNEIN